MNNIVKNLVLSTDGHEYPLHSMSWCGSPIVDACAVQADYGNLLVLTKDGRLHGVDFDAGVCLDLCAADLPVLADTDDNPCFGAACHRLHASSDGKYAAIVVDRGCEGLVVEVQSGVVTMHLNGGDYHEETVPFSACFLRYEGRNVFIHRTAWNRLDAADPATGESLTDRHIAPYLTAQDQPAHYLDYFHGQLRPSPDGSRLFDDGWCWQPVSIPRTWSVANWLSSNPWESEDGASVVDVTARDDWNTPACWISENHIALWGLADWDHEEFAETGQGPGVRVFDATESKQSSDRRWPMGGVAGRVLDLFSDGEHLYVAAETGTTVWDIASGSQIAGLDGFIARLHDSARRTLVAITSDSIVEFPIPWRAAK